MSRTYDQSYNSIWMIKLCGFQSRFPTEIIYSLSGVHEELISLFEKSLFHYYNLRAR